MIREIWIFNLNKGHNTKSQCIMQNTKPEGKSVENYEPTLLYNESEPLESWEMGWTR